MNNENLNLRGRLAVNEKLADSITIGIDMTIDEIRAYADKYEDKSELKSDRILLAANRLVQQHAEYRRLQKEIASIKRDLGEA
jgi:hypothetical protein